MKDYIYINMNIFRYVINFKYSVIFIELRN